MNKIFIILGIAIFVMIGVVWKSNLDRKAREEAFAQQTEQYKNKMSQLEVERQTRLKQEAQEAEDRANAEAEKIKVRQGSEKLTIALAEAAVKTQLFDPDSVKFRNQNGNCGEFNSKNKFGGYVGFSRYVYLASDNTVAIESDSKDSIWTPSIMNGLWDKYCH